MAERIYVGSKPHERDALGEKIRARIVQDLGIGMVGSIRTVAVYTINARLTQDDLTALAEGAFSDPIIQDYTINRSFVEQFDWLVEVGFRPGVTDNVGRTAKEACVIALDRTFPPDFSVHSATQYFFEGKAIRRHIERIAGEILANELIQSVTIYSREEWLSRHNKEFHPPLVTEDKEIVPYREIELGGSDEELAAISRRGMLALTSTEMRAIAEYYAQPAVRERRNANGLPANATNVELEILAQTWSEHCKHKIFNAHITYYDRDRDPQRVSSLFKYYIQKATETVRKQKGDKDFCLSVFKDNAGVIRFNDRWALSFKVETHNSPSALDPYGGALTGIVGVNRDPFGTGLGCKLIANTDVFCFASPFHEGALPPRILHPRRVMEGVREGVEHGGNKSGIPTVNGTIVFDERFLGKPLVYCGTLGIVPLEINGQKGYEKKALPGDHIVMVGGRIGKDGIHGATFSSEPLHEGSPATAVQIGDPITQRRMTDFLLVARDRGLYNSITDNGAGGLSSSVGEMAEDTGGATVHLERAPLKYHGLEPWEIFVSEAQERMTLAVEPDKIQAFLDLAKEWSVEATDLGEFNDSGYLTVHYGDTIVAELEMGFLHEGLPQMNLVARWNPAEPEAESPPVNSHDLKADVLDLLKRLNICSKEYVVRQYDHEVQGGSVVKPLCGVKSDGPSDAAVIRPLLASFEGVVVSNGIAPRYSDLDTYAMSCCVVDEAVRNAVCVGANPDHMAGLDNFCWCDPVRSPENPDGEYKLAQLVRANQALHDTCVHYGVPLVSGKDSMKNDYRIGDTKISIPPTLLFSVVAKIEDVRKAVTMDLKEGGNTLFILGTTYRELGKSEYAEMKSLAESMVPRLHHPRSVLKCYRQLNVAIGM
ncbi:MAG: phosphoribosylformylglycinamidine synthase, partial [Chitinivibrionales bacterium]|nr:phosphoribosylformylglycinamidine synthase [Chitinivibrionales bacterium]MBD3357958.1 phosphoribosylformylglycinamidine synthase [Chitinivibrionales bacterium]